MSNADLDDLGVQIPETLTYTGDVHAVRDWIEQTAAHHELTVDPGLMPTEVNGTLHVERDIHPDGEWRGTSFAKPGDILHFDPKQGISVQTDPVVTAALVEEFDRARPAPVRWEAGVDRPDPLQDLPVTETSPGVYRFTEPLSPAEAMDVMDQAQNGPPSPDVHRVTKLPHDRAWTPDEIRARSQQLSTPASGGPTFDGLPLDHERTVGEKHLVASVRTDQQKFVRSGAATAKQTNHSAKNRH